MSTPRIAVSARALALVTASVLLLGACSTESSGAGGGDGAAPLPTIGLGSDTGSQFAVVADPDGVAQVVMIGDSITVGATDELVAGFESAGLPVEIGAQSGKRIDVSTGSNPSGTRVAELFSLGAGGGDDALWVVALGTNDIGQFSDPAEVEQEIRDLVAVVPPQAPLVWINTWFTDRPEATEMVNDAITTVMRERGNTTIGDWATLATVDGVLVSDGVHTTDAGAQMFADLVVGTVRTFEQR